MTDAVNEGEDSFRSLFAGHSRAVLGYALRRVSEPADAADVVAETFLVAWRRLDEVPTGSDARLWLFGTARRVLANQRRGDLRRSRLADRLRQDLSGLVTSDGTATHATSDVVRRAVARLDADDRELLWLTSWEGLTPGQIAVVLDRAPGTVRSQLHRARGRLRSQLDAVGHHHGQAACEGPGHEGRGDRPATDQPGGERSGSERSGGAGHVRGDERLLVQDLRGER